MSGNTTRIVIILLTLFTAIVHGVVLNMQMGHIDPLFTLNGLGYLALLGAFVFKFPPSREALVHYAFMVYALVTIIAWVAIGERNMLGYSTKIVEVLLIVFLWMDLGRLPRRK
ncbi:MAG TPA: hypothetical protein VF982_04500 [Anaerolineales bacterium]|jgi:Na+/alanine symporter